MAPLLGRPPTFSGNVLRVLEARSPLLALSDKVAGLSLRVSAGGVSVGIAANNPWHGVDGTSSPLGCSGELRNLSSSALVPWAVAPRSVTVGLIKPSAIKWVLDSPHAVATLPNPTRAVATSHARSRLERSSF